MRKDYNQYTNINRTYTETTAEIAGDYAGRFLGFRMMMAYDALLFGHFFSNNTSLDYAY